jgi:hypothetical protein
MHERAAEIYESKAAERRGDVVDLRRVADDHRAAAARRRPQRGCRNAQGHNP